MESQVRELNWNSATRLVFQSIQPKNYFTKPSSELAKLLKNHQLRVVVKLNTTPNNRWENFISTLSPDGKTFTGKWDSEGFHKGTFYGWEGYKVCEAYRCTQPVKGGKWPR